MAKGLRLSADIVLPLEAITQKFAVVGTSGAGKTYGSLRLAELMVDAGAQIIALDPVGNWYSLRLASDGKGKGFSIPVFGGLRGDLPLDPGAGALVAKVIIERGISAVLDIHLMRKGERREFVTAFAEELFHLKKESRSPVHLFLEEAQSFVPQKVFKGEERMLGAFEDLTKIGRNYGIGWTIISQRPQAVNKDALNLAGTLLVFRLIGKHERKAVEDWIEEKDLDLAKAVKALPSLENGVCYCWSPEFLKTFEKTRVSKRVTFDASETPKLGDKPLKPRELSRMDVAELREALKTVVEKAERDDPHALRRRIADLERQLKSGPKIASVVAKTKELRIEVPVIKAREAQRIERAAKAISEALPALAESAENLRKALGMKPNPVPVHVPNVGVGGFRRAPKANVPERGAGSSPAASTSRQTGDVKLGRPHRKILTVLAQYPEGRTITQVALLTAYAVGGGAFRNPLSALRSAGYITGDGTLFITPDGQLALGEWEPLPAPGPDLLDYWMGRLSGPEKEIVRVLAEVWPKSLTPEEIAERTTSSKGTPYDPEGGAFRNPLSRLRTLELVKGRGEMKLSSDLMS